MKTTLAFATIALTVGLTGAFAQGTISIREDTSRRVYVADERAASALGLSSWGPTVYVPAGNTSLRVGLYFSLTENGTYTQVGDSTMFSAVSAGRIPSGNIVIPGVPGGSSAWFQLRVWEASYGANYESAISAGSAGGRLTIRGESNLMNVTVGTVTPTVLPWQSFGVYIPVPEPGTYALCLLGVAGWMMMMMMRRS